MAELCECDWVLSSYEKTSVEWTFSRGFFSQVEDADGFGILFNFSANCAGALLFFAN